MKSSTKHGIDEYVRVGLPVGNFLHAVLSNDLKGACMQADDANRADLVEIVTYCYWGIPGNCWGSQEVVNSWLDRWNRVRDELDAREAIS